MRWRKAVLAAGAGLAGFIITWAAFIAALVTTLDINPVGGSSGELTPSDRLIWYVGVPTIASIGNIPPMRVLGVRWWWGLLSALIAHIGAITIVLKVVVPMQSSSEPDQHIARAIALGAATTALLALLGSVGIRSGGMRLKVGGAVMLALAAFIPGVNLFIGFFVWGILPAIVALNQAGPGEEPPGK